MRQELQIMELHGQWEHLGAVRYEERGDFQKENGEMQTLFWKDLKKVESHLMNGDDDCPWFRIEQAQEQEGPEIYNFMQRIYEGIPDKSWFSMDKEEKILRYVATAGFAVKAEAPVGGHEYELAGIFYSPDIRTWGGESGEISEFERGRAYPCRAYGNCDGR